ncbi:50S ribosomal protein L11 methyltransferase [Fibrella sp. HMF5335]|uniref:Ribosomal protein L11 methyltransferase n=1 Tax=Fibrella rubiginis TaxID=2817060 RepID=A0A939GMB5_9BACT|nr:50S ribosomal protein L11 methyltransferase [Fibrella rubiginis]MBO0939435.1 50S ribosomal protein L11 methyltransferase [Fibrella rubiginis]
MNYTELQLTLDPDFADILTAELAELGFESFTETDEGINAYIPEPDFDAEAVAEVVARYSGQTAIGYVVNSLEKTNWNAEWEQNYQPIEVVTEGGMSARVRASFHAPDGAFTYDLVINPKMSFGTGHHETTHMMMQHQLGLDHVGKAILDVGSGTGILAILGLKLGAANALAFDIEEWAVENAIENASLNDCQQMRVFQGTIAGVDAAEQFDIILANINRNVLLAEIPTYVRHLKPGGQLLVSGFYETDSPDIQQTAGAVGLTKVGYLTRNQWASVVYQK